MPRSSGMTCTSFMGLLPRAAACARPLARCLAFHFATISYRPEPGRLGGRARDLGPHSRTARGHALEPPALAELLDEVQPKPPAEIRGARRDDTAAALVFHLQTHHRARALNPDEHDAAGRR